MSRIGAWPVAPETDIGRFRLLFGDTVGTPTDPPDGTATFSWWGDVEIVAFISSGGSVERALVFAYTQLSASAVPGSEQVRADDLNLGESREARDWLALAAFWGKRADEVEGQAGDWFTIVAPYGEHAGKAEAAPYPLGW